MTYGVGSKKKILTLALGLRHVVILLGLVFWHPSSLLSLNPQKSVTQYILDNWQIEDGLPQNSVQCITQSSDGYLWLGTEEGLARFDGVEFTLYNSSNNKIFKSNDINALHEDAAGRLWIGTAGGGLLCLQNGKFSSYGIENGLPNEIIRSLEVDGEGGVWVGTFGGGLARWFDGKFTTYNIRQTLPYKKIMALITDQQGRLWVGTDGGGITCLADGQTQLFTTREGLSDNDVSALYEDPQGRLWIGTDQGLDLFQDGHFRHFGRQEGLSSDVVISIWGDRDGSIWVGTIGGGINRFRDGHFSSLTSSQGLSRNWVKAVYEDKEGSLWIGTFGGGLNRLRDGKFLTFTGRDGLSHEMVRTLLGDRGGRLWAGTEGGGLNLLGKKSFQQIPLPGGNQHNLIEALAEDRDGSIWIGTWGDGVRHLVGNQVTTITTQQGLPSNTIYCLMVDPDGNLWVGTDRGLQRRSPGGAQVTYTTRQGLTNDIVRVLRPSRDGSLWIGTYGGGVCRLKDNVFTHYTTQEGLSDNIIYTLLEDQDGGLWIGTEAKGISFLKDGHIVNISTRDGLYNDTVFVIMDDHLDNLWMSCNKGIFSVSKQQLFDFIQGNSRRIICTVYDENDGMPARECNGSHLAGWRTADGQLWFPTIKGVVAIDPAKIRLNPYPPPVWLQKVKVEDQWLEDPAAVVVPAGGKNLELHYTALSLLAPRRVMFRYQLAGFDKNWVDAGTRRIAYYTNVPPGNYQFKVLACNNDGLWNEQGITIPVTIQPYFYQTGWFKILAGFGVILLVWGGYGLRLRQVKQHERQLAVEVEKRTADLRQASQELEKTNSQLRETMRQKEEVISMVAHDFRSPLTVIQGLSGQLKELTEGPEARRMLELIYERAKYLASLAANTLQMSTLEAGLLPMNFSPNNLTDLVRSLVFLQASQTKQEIHLEAPSEDLHLVFDYDRITDVVNNLIHNALKYSPQGGAIEVSLNLNDHEVQVSVQDHGIGIPAQDLPKLFQKFVRLKSAKERQIRGTGLGLYISKVIIEAHHGRIWAESEPGQGTTFSFALPMEWQPKQRVH